MYKLQTPLTITRYSCPYWAITEDGWLLLMGGYMWDGATKFPDFSWMMAPSAIHDALHQAIQVGAIPEYQNDMIDTELALAIEGVPAGKWAMKQMLKFRSSYVRRATNLVDEKKGNTIETFETQPLSGEYTLRQYLEARGQ